ncbi:N-acetyltransferase [Streptomyces spinoverrucosus]|uniref:N-acetyltransferase n=1 Tax=Streptomyces spinoverrucosus TaxID=284043 RepID=A0A4Y3VJP6_9ACTN|nr:GNAT family protein [Streptomyces spinoverrucosus]GEC05911.1 N-acetyltransferase [Streptomyces spinoverrucosus]GHB74498.1 N-acetyltransferase [Streptomyces spinoverrucosus]
MYPVHRLSQRLELRELQADDADAVFAIYGSDAATEHLSCEPRTLDEVRQIVTRSIETAKATPRSEYALAVVEGSTGALVGFGRLALDPHQPGGATMGFALRPVSWGHGYGVETVRLLFALGFEELGLHRIWGARSPVNEASAKAMARAGMVEEGRIREHVRKGGAWRDSIVHAILDREWTAQRT